MPTYEYQCKVCNYKFDAFQRITEKPLKCCPKCGKNVQRLIGKGAGIIFKGSGFHETDYRSEHYKKRLNEEKQMVDSAGKTKEKTEKKSSSNQHDSATSSKA